MTGCRAPSRCTPSSGATSRCPRTSWRSWPSPTAGTSSTCRATRAPPSRSAATTGLVRRGAMRAPASSARRCLAVDLDLGDRRAYRVGQHELLGVASVAFSPDGQWLAFIGINDAGIRDVYVLALAGRRGRQAPQAHRRHLRRAAGHLGPQRHHLHLGRHVPPPLQPVPRQAGRAGPRRAPHHPASEDHADPLALDDGRIFFVAYQQQQLGSARADERTARIVRRTDVTTGVFEPGPGPDGGLWMLFHQSGERRPSLLRPPKMLSLPRRQRRSRRRLPRRWRYARWTEAENYRPFAGQNIEVGPIFGFAGAGAAASSARCSPRPVIG